MMDNIILVGDSIFDNAPYVADGQTVADHLQHELRNEAEVTLLAVDGSFANEVPGQLRKLPRSATHLFMSAGGNDALGARTALDGFSLEAGGPDRAAAPDSAGSPDAAGELEELRGPDSRRVLKELGSATHLLDVLSILQHEFARNYEKALSSVRKTGLPAVACTVYDSIPHLEARYRTALSVFNDHIIRRAAAFGFPVLDLRAICNEEADYAPVSPIEPSDTGGRKIAAAIARVYRRDRAGGVVTEIWS